MVKGIGFPTCIGINNVVGNMSPLNDNKTVLADGDVVKVDLGVTIDGYVAMVAHTVVVGAASEAATNLINATYTASQAAVRLLQAGKTNSEVTEAMCAVASERGVNPMVGVLSHNIVRFRCDGEKVIAQVDEPDRKANTIEFESGEAYILDVIFTTGEGKPTVADTKPTVYKRNPTVKAGALKMKASQQLMQQVDRNAPCFPFSLRAFDARTATLGAVECLRVGSLEMLPVMTEKKATIVAQFKYTVLLNTDGTTQVLASGPAY
jgi:curved DNA binding protein